MAGAGLGAAGLAMVALGGCGEEKPAATATTAAPAATTAAPAAATKAATTAAPAAGTAAATIRCQYWDLSQKPPYEASLKEFMSKNPSITVNMEQIGFADYWTKLQTDFAAGRKI